VAAGSACLLLMGAPSRAQLSNAMLAACSACHGPGGNSMIPDTPSIAGQPRVFIENQMVLIREGLREVPVMKDVVASLKDEDIVALATYFAAQPIVPRPTPVQADKARLGEQISGKALCGTCHRPDFMGQQQVPRLAGQNEEYLLQAMKQFRDHPGPGRDTIMSASLHGIGDAELAALAHYFAGIKPR